MPILIARQKHTSSLPLQPYKNSRPLMRPCGVFVVSFWWSLGCSFRCSFYMLFLGVYEGDRKEHTYFVQETFPCITSDDD